MAYRPPTELPNPKLFTERPATTPVEKPIKVADKSPSVSTRGGQIRNSSPKLGVTFFTLELDA